VLTERAFRHGIKLTAGQIDTLDAMAMGHYKPRNAVAVLGALRTKMEYAYSKPKQETELSGNVSITVSSPVPTRASYIKARQIDAPQHLVSSSTQNVLGSQQGPEIGSYVNSTTSSGALTNEPELIADPEVDPDVAQPAAFDPLTAPTIHRVGRLIATDEPKLTAEQRRELARADWLADKATP